MVGGRRPAHQPRNNNRYSTKGSSPLSSPGDLGTSSRKALWNKKKSSGEGGGSASRLAPSSGGNRRRITRMFTTIVRDPDTQLLLAVFVSNAYDRAQFLNGTLDYEGGNAKARMVKFPMRLFYTNARNTRYVFSSFIITFCQSLPTYYIYTDLPIFRASPLRAFVITIQPTWPLDSMRTKQ
jgi:hypothetical protein